MTSSTAVATRLVLISGSGILAGNILLPSIPLIAKAMLLPVTDLSLAAASYSGGYAIAHLLYGSIPERVSTNRILALGLLLLFLATLCALGASSLSLFLPAVAIMGVGAAAAPALLPSLISDAYRDANSSSTMSMLAAIEGGLPPVSAMLGTLVALTFGWRAAFLVIAASTAVSAFALRTVRRSKIASNSGQGGVVARYGSFFRDPNVLGYTVAAAAPFSALVIFMNLSPAILADYYQVAPITFGVMQIFTVATFVVGSIVSIRISPRYTVLAIDRIGLALIFATGIAFVLIAAFSSTSPVLYIAAVLPSQLGFGIRLGPMLNEAIRISTLPRITSVNFGFITFALASLITFIMAKANLTDPAAIATGFAVFSALGLVCHLVLLGRRSAGSS